MCGRIVSIVVTCVFAPATDRGLLIGAWELSPCYWATCCDGLLFIAAGAGRTSAATFTAWAIAMACCARGLVFAAVDAGEKTFLVEVL